MCEDRRSELLALAKSSPAELITKSLEVCAEIHSAQDRDSADSYGVEKVAELIEAVLAEKQHCVFALAGGSSVSGVIAGLAEKSGIDWSRVIFTHADERCVAFDSDERNWRVAEPLVNKLKQRSEIESDNLAILGELSETASDTEIAEAVDQMAKRVTGIDIALLGLGEDGHVASLFPNHPSLETTGTFAIVHDSPKPPPTRITATLAALTQAHVVALGFGEGKSEAIQALFEEGTLEEIPGRLIHLAQSATFITSK